MIIVYESREDLINTFDVMTLERPPICADAHVLIC